MMSLTYRKLELLIWLEYTGRMCHSDVASSPFKCHFGALTWPCGTLMKSSWNLAF